MLPPVDSGPVELLLEPRPEPSGTAVEQGMLPEEVLLPSPAVLGPVALEASVSLEDLQTATSASPGGRSPGAGVLLLRPALAGRRQPQS